MRKDLDKILACGISRARDWDHDDPKYSKTKAKIHPDHFNDEDHGPVKAKFNLSHRLYTDYNKLHKILKSEIGRPWNKVYSELIENLGSLNRANFEKTLERVVEKHVTFVDNIPYESTVCYGHQLEVHGLYVHPYTGLLCIHNRQKRQPKAVQINKLKIGDQSYELIDELWYRVTEFSTKETIYINRNTVLPSVQLKYDEVTKNGPYRTDYYFGCYSLLYKSGKNGWKQENTSSDWKRKSVNKKELKIIKEFLDKQKAN